MFQGTPSLNIESKQYIPHCDKDLIPILHMMFETLNEGIEFYKKYARACGFDVRLSTEKKYKGVITTRYCVCSKEGERGENSNAVRTRLVSRENCEAKIAFQRIANGKYWVYKFVEYHSHILASPISRQHLKGHPICIVDIKGST
jgi:FAR1 DNA-binding domain-containing protein